jgi:hypothetical protein
MVNKIILGSFLALLLNGCGGGSSSSEKYDFSEYMFKSDVAIDDTYRYQYDLYEKTVGDETMSSTSINYIAYTFEVETMNRFVANTSNGNNFVYIKSDTSIEEIEITEVNTSTVLKRHAIVGDVLHDEDSTSNDSIRTNFKLELSNHFETFTLYDGYKVYNDVLEVKTTQTEFEVGTNEIEETDSWFSYYAKGIGFIGRTDRDCYPAGSTFLKDNETVCETEEIYYYIKQD